MTAILEKPSMKASHKVCAKCGFDKPTSDYFRNQRNKDGLQHWCKDCMKTYNREQRMRHRQGRIEPEEVVQRLSNPDLHETPEAPKSLSLRLRKVADAMEVFEEEVAKLETIASSFDDPPTVS